jgi:putative ribosome biogenesis GTPase RsgA
MSYNLAVPKKSNPSTRQFKVGDRVKVSLPLGRIVDATIKAVIDRTDGLHLQVDYGNDQTALVSVRQVLP